MEELINVGLLIVWGVFWAIVATKKIEPAVGARLLQSQRLSVIDQLLSCGLCCAWWSTLGPAVVMFGWRGVLIAAAAGVAAVWGA